MLEVKSVEAGYGQLRILQGVSVAVASGELVGIIGPNGSGKSTLLKTIYGYLAPFAGLVHFNGNPITGMRADQIQRQGIGFVAQAGGLFNDLTIQENLVMGAYSISDRRIAKERIEQVLTKFPKFRERRSQKAGSLSGGEQRVLAVARTLITAPPMMLLDEPSAALSHRAGDELYEMLEKLNAEGITFLIVEQNIELIMRIASRIYVLEMGRNAFEGTPAELSSSDKIRSLYIGNMELA